MRTDHHIPAPQSWLLGHEEIHLSENEVHLWRVFSNCSFVSLRQLERTLSSGERSRAQRFHRESDRVDFVVAHGVLRQLLAKYLGQTASELEFGASHRGKPYLISASSCALQFNVSHSHGLALIAVANRRVGVDLERMKFDIDVCAIAERYFSTQELVELRALPPALRSEGYFLDWTRKEAYLKATGDGVYRPLNSFEVSLTPGASAELRSEDSSKWQMRSLYPHPGYAAALVVEGSDWELRCCEWRFPSDDHLATGAYPNTAFNSKNSSSPASPHSRPLPDCL